MSSRDVTDEAALYARVEADCGRRVTAAWDGLGVAARGCADVRPLVRTHPLICAGSAVALGFIGVVAVRYRFQKREVLPAPSTAATASPAPTATKTMVQRARGWAMRALLDGFLIPFVTQRLQGWMANCAATHPEAERERPDA